MPSTVRPIVIEMDAALQSNVEDSLSIVTRSDGVRPTASPHIVQNGMLFYVYRNSTGEGLCRISRVIDGVESEIVSKGVVIPLSFKIKIVDYGRSLSLSIDSALIISGTDNKGTSSGLITLYSMQFYVTHHAVWIDNFSLTRSP